MDKVSVDDDFARFGNKSYAINKINSVEIRERKPYGSGGPFVAGLLGVLLLLAWLGSANAPGGRPLALLLIGGVLIALAFWGYQRSKVVEYALILMTSSSEAQAFASQDEDEVLGLRDQIEGAMLRNSRGTVRPSRAAMR